MDYRPMGFESDIGNQNFMGAQNPDEMLYTEFYWHEPEDWNKSQEQGKLVRGPKIPYIRIQRPGDKTSIVETPVREDHKARWPNKWLYWQMKEGLIDSGADIPGWKIEEWDVLKADQLHELKYLRFYTVEQIAGASDDQVQRMGIGGLGLREQARQALRNKMGAEVKEVLAEKDKEIAEMKARMERLEALIMQPTASQVPEPARAGAQGEGAVSQQGEPLSLTTAIATPTVAVQSERDFLVAQYVAKHGKKPHHKLSVEKIRAALA